jgi:PAS domain-containing protein
VGADLEACFYRGKAAVRDNMFIPILFNGVLEDHYWSYSLIPVYENGRIGGVYDAFRNMTSTVVGAQRLRESEVRLKLATEVAKLGVFVWDTVEDRGSWENDRMYEIFGRSRSENPFDGQEFLRDIVHPDYRDSFQQAVERTVRNGDPLRCVPQVCLSVYTLVLTFPDASTFNFDLRSQSRWFAVSVADGDQERHSGGGVGLDADTEFRRNHSRWNRGNKAGGSGRSTACL